MALDHSLYDVLVLRDAGIELLKKLDANVSIQNAPGRARAWIQGLDGLMKDNVDAQSRLVLQEGVNVIHDALVLGKTLARPDFVNGFRRIVGAVNQLLKTAELSETNVDVSAYRTFLSASMVVGTDLPLDARVPFEEVRKLAQQDPVTAKRSLARLVERGLATFRETIRVRS